LSGRVAGGVRALKAIDERMRTQFGAEAAPDFGQVSGLLAKIDKVLRAQLAARPSVAMGADEGSEAAGESRPFTGVIRSREEAVRALEAVADYFVKNEPSSPVPLICNRAKGLVSRGFLEVLEDIAPEAVKQARAAGGLKD